MDQKHILIIEDEPDLREAMVSALEVAGYSVSATRDGQQGLDTALTSQPDLILLDLILPHLGGQAILKKLQADDWGKNANVIVLTALDDMNSLSDAMSSGAVDFLVKSDVSLLDIVEKVKQKIGT